VLNFNNLVNIADRAFEGAIANYLTELDLRSNRLGKVPSSGALANLPRLRTLILAKNQLLNVVQRPFQNYACRQSLTKLDLAGNQLTSVDQRAFEDLVNLEEVSLEANRLSFLPEPLFSGVRRLKNLNLGLNRLTSVPVKSLAFPNLQSLSLEFNNITMLPGETLKDLTKLAYLSLTGNKISHWDPEMFRCDKIRLAKTCFKCTSNQVCGRSENTGHGRNSDHPHSRKRLPEHQEPAQVGDDRICRADDRARRLPADRARGDHSAEQEQAAQVT